MMNATKAVTKVHSGVFYWRATTTMITIEEAKEIAERVKKEVSSPSIKYFIVDNRELNGPYKPDVQQVWSDLMDVVAQNVEKNVVICKDIIQQMQINRISKNTGTTDKVKAFMDEKEALAFINLTSFPF
ncbi:hypothetical protein [Fictibacillus phosphorivorans]|nr:hypothetical protein [Fictibacillus phosphorivorans]